MTQITLESKNEKDVILIKELAERLHLKYKIDVIQEKTVTNNLEHYYNIIQKGVDVSNYGDPVKWQKKIREDRAINFS